MQKQDWCEHEEKTTKYTVVRHYAEEEPVAIRVQTWMCPHCGSHGAYTEILPEKYNQ